MNRVAFLARSGRRLAVAACGLLAACTFLMDWDPEGLKCSDTDACDVGYSCLGDVCKADRTLTVGETCIHPQQCTGDLVCSSLPYFACRRPCSAYFGYEGCGADEYCRPYLAETRDPSTRVPDGSCVKSECSDTSPCSTGKTCVRIHTGASACLTGCEITWKAGLYQDSCGSSAAQQQYCQPVGIATAPKAQRLACLDLIVSQSTVQDEGQGCSPVLQPCKEGLACVSAGTSGQGKCFKYCDPSVTECPGPNGLTGSCVAKPVEDGTTYGICI